MPLHITSIYNIYCDVFHKVNCPDLNCQNQGVFFKIKRVEVLNGRRDTQRSTHGTRDKCIHVGTAPVTYHRTRSYMSFIILISEVPADYAVQPTVQCEEVRSWCHLCMSTFVRMFVCTCVCWKRKCVQAVST